MGERRELQGVLKMLLKLLRADMDRRFLYSLCERWGKWAESLDSLGITGIALFMNANSGSRCGVPSSDLMYSFPSQEIKDVHEAIETLCDEDKAIILAKFKRGLSYNRIGQILGYSKPWAQQRVGKILNEIEIILDSELEYKAG